VTSDAGLARMDAYIRTLRLADGPDEVHCRAIARLEMRKYTNARVQRCGALHCRSGGRKIVNPFLAQAEVGWLGRPANSVANDPKVTSDRGMCCGAHKRPAEQ
jgi:hypothetical protein